MKIKLALCLAVAAVALAPGAAHAAFKTGRYAGTTSQGAPVSFKASKRFVTNLRVGLAFACTDGDSYQQLFTGFPRIRLSRSGRFAAGFTSGDGASHLQIRGRLNLARGTGSVAAVEIFDTTNERNPNGTVRCVGSATFRVRRR